MRAVSILLLLAVLAGCDAFVREDQIEKCVAANIADGVKEGTARAGCMKAAYGR